VAKVTGIDRSSIIALARSFARAKHPLAICGKGKGSVPGSAAEFMAVHALNALVGNINKKGGVWAVPMPDYIHWPELEMDQFATDGFQQARIDGAGSKKYPHTRHMPSRFFKNIALSDDPLVKILLVTEANPLYTHSGTAAVKKAFDKIPFVVSFSSYMDETAKHADLILPNHVYLERYGDVPRASGFSKPFIGFVNPVVEPQFDTMHTGDVIIKLAKQMGDMFESAFAWDGYQACLEETLGDFWDERSEKGYWVDTDFEPSSWSSAFETESGVFEFKSSSIGTYANYTPIAPEGDSSSYPLLLIPYDSQCLASGYIGNPPFVNKTVADTVLKGNDIFVEINPETAKSHGLADGKPAKLSTPAGKAIVRIHHFDGIMPGVVAIPRGLGHTAYDKFLGGKGVNFNALIAPVEDPASGLNVVWGIRAKINRA
jgi:anaerobic selenocysteine-containing dehydrogenase